MSNASWPLNYVESTKSVIHRLYSADVDFPQRSPRLMYMLASSPRSGSTYCAVRLWQTGMLGAPLEYLNFRVIGDIFERLGHKVDSDGYLDEKSVSKYWEDIRRIRTSQNGIFGFKMFTNNYVEIASKYPAFLESINPRFVIYLTRKDALGQAMSLSRAQQSKVWFSEGKSKKEAVYDFADIKRCVNEVERQNQTWERIFTYTGTEPVRIYYEDLLKDSASTITMIFNELGISDCPAYPVNIPMLVRQTDGISSDWRERFLEDSYRETVGSV